MKQLFAIVVIVSSLMGCDTFHGIETIPSDTSSTVADSIREQTEQTSEIAEASSEISKNLNEIDSHTNTILNDIAVAPNQDDPILYSIENSANAIKETVDKAQQEEIRISEALEDLQQANSRLNSAANDVKELEETIEKYKESDREIRKEALENLHSFITLFFVIGFGMLIGGAFLTFWVSGRIGGVVLGIGILTVGFAAASQYYLEEIAVIGLVVLIIGFFGTLGIIAWLLIDGKHDKKAVMEIVGLVEALKRHLTKEEREEIFGPKGIASQMTSDITKRVIAQIKIKNGFNFPVQKD